MVADRVSHHHQFRVTRFEFTTDRVGCSLAYPLFYVFLPDYLESRGAQTGESSPYYVWRNYLISNAVSVFSPIIAGVMANTGLGRKYTMVIGAISSVSFPIRSIFWQGGVSS